ncbi:methyltransferase domain-containing protein [Roseomonas sp. F4]
MNAPLTQRPLPDPNSTTTPQRRPGWAAGRRLAFLHIPKTAGTAFGAALAQHFAAEEIASTLRLALAAGAADPMLGCVAPAFRALGIGSHLDHDKLDAINASLPPGEKLFIVTVLRDPRARLISQYRHWRRSVDSTLADLAPEHREAFLAARHMSLDDFLAARIPFAEDHFRNMQARMLSGYGTSELMDEATLLATARARMAAIDVVGTTDTVDETLARIAEAYGWSPPDSVRPLNVAPGEAPGELAPETEALIAELTRVDRALWEEAQASADTSPLPREQRSYFLPDTAMTATLLEGAKMRFGMDQALDGQGWHVREGAGETLSRWTGPGRRASIRLRAPQMRRVDLAIRLVSVLDWAMVDGIALTLDGVPPRAPHRVEHGLPQPVLHASFDMPDAGDGRRELVLEVPFTRSHHDIDPSIDDTRQKGIAIGGIVLSAPADTSAGPATLGDLFWPGAPWSNASPAQLMDLVPYQPPEAEPPVAERHMTLDMPLLRGVLELVQPDHVWAAALQTFLGAVERGTPLARPSPDGRLAVVVTLFEIAARGAPIAALSERFTEAVLLLPCAEDFRLREVAASPLYAPFLHIVGCTNGVLVANLAAMRREGGQARVEALLLKLERISATMPEKLATLRGDFAPAYALQQLDATLRGMAALNDGTAGTRDLLATLMLEAAPPTPSPAALRERGRAVLAKPGSPITLVEPALLGRLEQLLDQLVAASEPQACWDAALVAQECAFRITSILAGWQRFNLSGNATGQLALALRPGLPRPPLYPKPAKPFAEYIDFYKSEAVAMSRHPHAPDLITRLDLLRGGLDHVTRLNQAAREVEIALRLLGDRFPGEEILWVDAGCSYGVIMNAVVPPANILGRCAFLGFDFNAPAIEAARIVAGNLGHAHCRYEIGDVAEARSLAQGRRIHLITAFEVLEHCPDPVAVLRDYRAMEPGMLVIGSPLAEAQGIFPAEQHIWAFNGRGFAEMAEAAGFTVYGINQRQVGHFVGGHDWVTVAATTGDPKTMAML